MQSNIIVDVLLAFFVTFQSFMLGFFSLNMFNLNKTMVLVHYWCSYFPDFLQYFMEYWDWCSFINFLLMEEVMKVKIIILRFLNITAITLTCYARQRKFMTGTKIKWPVPHSFVIAGHSDRHSLKIISVPVFRCYLMLLNVTMPLKSQN